MTAGKNDLLHRPRHDWSARARSTAMDALRYTQFVGVMKRALPVAAFAVIAAVLAFFFVTRQPARLTMGYEQLGHVENDLAMVKPRLTGQDAKGNPFVITAQMAIQDSKNPKRARLTGVEADLTIGDKNWINADAHTGRVDMKAGTLILDGGINVFSDSGYELHSRSALIDLRHGTVDGRTEVAGHGPLGSLRADRFHFDRDSDLVQFDGHVQMTIVGVKT